MTVPLIIIGKLVAFFSRTFKIGSGATWPGEIALRFKPDILNYFSKQLKEGSVLVAGTNGKTTTSLMVNKILTYHGKKVLLNDSGANLLNGIVSAFINNAGWAGKIHADMGVFEVDENSLPKVMEYLTPKILIVTNLFRDQLDRYGEVDMIIKKWIKALEKLPSATTIVLNSDDPGVASLGSNIRARTVHFGIQNKKYFLPQKEHATDSIFCLRCGARLKYEGIYYSHLGIWRCVCGNTRPKPQLSCWDSPLPGLYNKYNFLAAASCALVVGLKEAKIKKSLVNFVPAFGRQEEFTFRNKKIKIFLSKNPAGFNESLRTVISLGAKNLLLVLNDRIPDGRDVSWIWDVDFELLTNQHELFVSGDRCYDMALRLKYALKSQISNLKSQNQNSKLKTYQNLKDAINEGLNKLNYDETLYILPTYSAMLEVRKILTGRKIL